MRPANYSFKRWPLVIRRVCARVYSIGGCAFLNRYEGVVINNHHSSFGMRRLWCRMVHPFHRASDTRGSERRSCRSLLFLDLLFSLTTSLIDIRGYPCHKLLDSSPLAGNRRSCLPEVTNFVSQFL